MANKQQENSRSRIKVFLACFEDGHTDGDIRRRSGELHRQTRNKRHMDEERHKHTHREEDIVRMRALQKQKQARGISETTDTKETR